MLQIEKIFEKVEPRNHSINGYINNKIRIKDNNFSIKSIYKMVEHFKWMRKNMNICETKIIIDSDFIADQAILTLMESIIFFVINEWKFKVTYRFSIKENVIGYQIFKKSILFKYNNKKIVIEEYNREYNKKITTKYGKIILRVTSAVIKFNLLTKKIGWLLAAASRDDTASYARVYQAVVTADKR